MEARCGTVVARRKAQLRFTFASVRTQITRNKNLNRLGDLKNEIKTSLESTPYCALRFPL